MQQPKRTSSMMAGSMPARLDSFLHGDAADGGRVGIFEGAAEGPDGGAAGGYDNDIFHVFLLVHDWCCWLLGMLFNS
jgi:hypothetical protein